VLVLEAQARVGGPAETRRVGEFMLERGPNTVRATPELEKLIRRTGLEVLPARRGAPYLVSNGELLRLPPPPRNLLRGDPIPLRGWLELLGEPFRAQQPGPRSVEEFVRQRLGPTLAERLADVMTLGVFGTTADRVGFESAFPALADRLQRSRSLTRMLAGAIFQRREKTPGKQGLISTPEGLAVIPQRVAERLGERIHLDAPVRHVVQRDGGFELSVGASGETKVASRHLVLAVPPAAPSRERLPLMGCLFPSALFPGRAPEGHLLLTVFVGPALRDAAETTLADELAPLLERLLGATRAPTLLDVARYPLGITLYDRRHRDRTRVLRQHLDDAGGPLLAGAAFDGVAFGAAAASGIRAARQLLRIPSEA
jgi:oxygen-dependent protoporphyrinogen oxidase